MLFHLNHLNIGFRRFFHSGTKEKTGIGRLIIGYILGCNCQSVLGIMHQGPDTMPGGNCCSVNPQILIVGCPDCNNTTAEVFHLPPRYCLCSGNKHNYRKGKIFSHIRSALVQISFEITTFNTPNTCCREHQVQAREHFRGFRCLR
jgi:hypothetical protein